MGTREYYLTGVLSAVRRAHCPPAIYSSLPLPRDRQPPAGPTLLRSHPFSSFLVIRLPLFIYPPLPITGPAAVIRAACVDRQPPFRDLGMWDSGRPENLAGSMITPIAAITTRLETTAGGRVGWRTSWVWKMAGFSITTGFNPTSERGSWT